MFSGEGNRYESLSQPPQPLYSCPATFPLAWASMNERTVISKGGISITLALIEPIVFQAQFKNGDSNYAKPKMLRGYLRLRIENPTRMNRIDLSFSGIAQTVLGGNRVTKELRRHVWPVLLAGNLLEIPSVGRVFAAQDFQNRRQSSTGEPLNTAQLASTFQKFESSNPFRSYTAKTLFFIKDQVPLIEPKEVEKADSRMSKSGSRSSTTSRILPTGEYIYEFEQLIDHKHPATINVPAISVRWLFEVLFESPDHNISPIKGKLEVPFVRIPSEDQLAFSEPTFNAHINNRYAFEISISDQTTTPGSDNYIYFKFTPKTRVICQTLEISIVEKISMKMTGNGITDLEPPQRIVLLNKQFMPDTNPNFFESHAKVSLQLAKLKQRGFQLDVKYAFRIPDSERNEQGCRPSIHFDATYDQFEISHKVGVKIKTTSFDEDHPPGGKVSFVYSELPLTILSPLATPSDIFLPHYYRNDPKSSLSISQHLTTSKNTQSNIQPSKKTQDAPNMEFQQISKNVELIAKPQLAYIRKKPWSSENWSEM